MEYLTLFLTYMCNLNCGYCKRGSRAGGMCLDLDLAKKIVDQVRDISIDGIALTGGEPGLYPHFQEIAEYILDAGVDLAFVTNGWNQKPYQFLLNQNRGELAYVCVSLDGIGEVHDRQRGEGSFERAVDTINLFVGSGIAVRTMTVVTPLNMHQIPETVKFVADLGVGAPNFCAMVPYVQRDWLLSDKQRQNSISLVKYGSEQAEIECFVNESLWTGGGLDFCPGIRYLRDIAIRPDGKFQLCCDLEGEHGVVGDANQESLSDLLCKADDLGRKVEERRGEYFRRGEFFDGFDTCLFCDRVLREIRGAGEIGACLP